MEQNEIYAALPGVLLPWYEKNARDLPWRHTKEPYRVWVSEIMLQQTRVEAVIGYYERFMEAFPTVQALAEADEARVLKLWEGLGYYSRARNLQKTAKLLTETQNGAFPDTAEALEKLPGIGAYTAGAVASICFEQPAAAVDGNVLRIIMRMTADDHPIDLPQVKKEIGEALCKVYPKGHCGAFTQALMELGACVCTPKSPKCEVCPTKSFCRAYKAGNVTKYPVKRPKAAKKSAPCFCSNATADSPWKSEARRVCSPGYGSFRTYLKSSMPKPPCKQRRAFTPTRRSWCSKRTRRTFSRIFAGR